MMSSVLGVLAVVAFVAVLIAAFVYRERVGKYVETQMKTVGGSPKVSGRTLGGFVAWLLLLIALWFLSDMMPFWDWLTFHRKYFIALNLWLLSVALLWNTGGWARLFLSLIGILLLFIAIVAGLAAAWEKFDNWRAESKATAAIQQAAVAPPRVPEKTVKRIVAPPDNKGMGNLSEPVSVPPGHNFAFECAEPVWVVTATGKIVLSNCSKEPFREPMHPPFRFGSASEQEVPVTVSYWAERK